MKIKELKEKLEAKTSEELFGIDEQPEQNCPKVDKGRDFGTQFFTKHKTRYDNKNFN